MLKALRFFGWPLLAGVLIALLIIQRYPQWVGLPSLDVNLQQAPQTTSVQQGPVSYADAVVIAAPSVVNLYTTKVINKPAHPLFEDPQFRRFFGDNSPKQKRMESSLGSGVIMSPEGYILTNNHVIDGADEIEVQLSDGRKSRAKLIGADPDSDIAVLKVDLQDLPVIMLGASDQLAVGDVVLAIGNPFGVGETVTSGIVSALGRSDLGLNTFENFIQTDAAINPGNSGGALVDVQGHLVGINTAIYSRSGGSMGIGFAIPSATARNVMEAIVRDGAVTRGWIGVEPQDLTPELAQYFGTGSQDGVVITGVLQNGPAAKAGIRPGDVIVQVNSRAIGNVSELLSTVASLQPGTKAQLQVWRRQGLTDISVTPSQRPSPRQRPR